MTNPDIAILDKYPTCLIFITFSIRYENLENPRIMTSKPWVTGSNSVDSPEPTHQQKGEDGAGERGLGGEKGRKYGHQ